MLADHFSRVEEPWVPSAPLLNDLQLPSLGLVPKPHLEERIDDPQEEVNEDDDEGLVPQGFG